jgi:imidazolonepropionase
MPTPATAPTADWDELIVDARLCTLEGEDGWGLVEHGAIGWRGDAITFAGPMAALPGPPAALAARVGSAGGALVTPGLVDAHTHAVFAGDRSDEAARRLAGETYADIARGGGGILATMRATRKADVDALVAAALHRVRALVGDGSTTLEIKSGYGLTLESERRMLLAARALGERLGITVSTSFLGAHALPPEFAGRPDDYIATLCNDWLPRLAREGLVDAVDAYCEGVGFSPAQVRTLFEAARGLGLPVKLHADQLSDLGGARLAASFRALSADHVEYTDEAGVRAMAEAGTVAMLLPGAFLCLGETRRPPVAAFRAHGVPMAVATDLNPGTSPVASQRLAIGLASLLFGLRADEALRGATHVGARALGLHDRGRLRAGLRADLVVWDAVQPAALGYWLGGPLARRVVAGGRTVAGG